MPLLLVCANFRHEHAPFFHTLRLTQQMFLPVLASFSRGFVSVPAPVRFFVTIQLNFVPYTSLYVDLILPGFVRPQFSISGMRFFILNVIQRVIFASIS